VLGIPIERLKREAEQAAAVATAALFAGRVEPGSFVAQLVAEQALLGATVAGAPGTGPRFSAAELGPMPHRCLRVARALRTYRTTDPLVRAAARAGARLAVRVARFVIAAATIRPEGVPS